MSELEASHPSQVYFDCLRLYRDICLEEHAAQTRFKLGSLAIGAAEAYWESCGGGTAYLCDGGLRLGRFDLVTWPTTLELYQPTGEGDILTTFYMKLEDKSRVIACTSYLISMSTWEKARNCFASLNSRIKGTASISHDQSLILYTEMQRGASGEYKL